MSQSTRARANSQQSQISKKSIRKYSSDYYDSDASDSEPMIKKRIVKIWTPEEDQMLQDCYEKFNGNWTQVAQAIPGRNQSQCSQRWKRINPNRIKMRKQWTEEEDRQVLRLIQKFGKNWKRIENEMTGRSGKQIRERFINKLDKTINHDPFDEREDEEIYKLYISLGPRWSEISKNLIGRPENSVKNRFYSHIKKHYNIQTKESDSDGKEITPQQQYSKCDFTGKDYLIEQIQKEDKKLDTIQSQFEQENSINNLQQHNHYMQTSYNGLGKADSLNSNGDFLQFAQQMSLEQKHLYATDINQQGSNIFQDVQLPFHDLLDDQQDQQSLSKKASLYLRTDSDIVNQDLQLQYQLSKMSMELE
ncbi:unnamed protein product (macronuclear) [Paramecium tetraurelia]|uniref:Uncharacterized protein n=1 Tax=Paramecium tetraurelia TaxID=5888 RepID=A0D763_PARTE|nr:uncharacterized protein GSPATT00001921001 [Paramecium tetraurelia]CAK78880.1 unnamed protein product [Paramecium tetraurelia]|eukprot:XP_001446277.1 hypothetical protein (macronuclear) [Paramecium tetraurelia strain d4-2]